MAKPISTKRKKKELLKALSILDTMGCKWDNFHLEYGEGDVIATSPLNTGAAGTALNRLGCNISSADNIAKFYLAIIFIDSKRMNFQVRCDEYNGNTIMVTNESLSFSTIGLKPRWKPITIDTPEFLKVYNTIVNQVDADLINVLEV